ncbi:MAG: hypothetical protein HYY13_04790 [Nitrospirae bacterium]|nr:hypothetical protein [Nitrospirota bacterium]
MTPPESRIKPPHFADAFVIVVLAGLALLRLGFFSSSPALFDSPLYLHHLSFDDLRFHNMMPDAPRRYFFVLLVQLVRKAAAPLVGLSPETAMGLLAALGGSIALAFLYLTLRSLRIERGTALLATLVAGLLPRGLVLDLMGNPHPVSYMFYMISLWAWGLACSFDPRPAGGGSRGRPLLSVAGGSVVAGMAFASAFAAHVSVAPWAMAHAGVALFHVSGSGAHRGHVRVVTGVLLRAATAILAAGAMLALLGAVQMATASPPRSVGIGGLVSAYFTTTGTSPRVLLVAGAAESVVAGVVSSTTWLVALLGLMGILACLPNVRLFLVLLLWLVPLAYAQLSPHEFNWQGRFTIPGLFVLALGAAHLSRAPAGFLPPFGRWLSFLLTTLLLADLVFPTAGIIRALRGDAPAMRLQALARTLPGAEVLLFPEYLRMFFQPPMFVQPGIHMEVSQDGPANTELVLDAIQQGKRVFSDFGSLNFPARGYDGWFSPRPFQRDRATTTHPATASLWRNHVVEPVRVDDPRLGLVYYEIKAADPEHRRPIGFASGFSSGVQGSVVVRVSFLDAGGIAVRGAVVCLEILEPGFRFSPLDFSRLDPAVHLIYRLRDTFDAYGCARTDKRGIATLLVPDGVVGRIRPLVYCDLMSRREETSYPFLPQGGLRLREIAANTVDPSESLNLPGVSVVAFGPDLGESSIRSPRLLGRFVPELPLDTYTMEAEISSFHQGRVVRDPSASSGQALQLSRALSDQGPVWGPYVDLPPGSYTAHFRLRYEPMILGVGYRSGAPITTLNVADVAGLVDISSEVWPRSRRESTEYLELPIAFEARAPGVFEFRLLGRNARAVIYLDTIRVEPVGETAVRGGP